MTVDPNSASCTYQTRWGSVEAVRRSTSDVFSGSWAPWLPGPGRRAAAEGLKRRGLGELGSLTWQVREIQTTENSAQRARIFSYDHVANAHVEHVSVAGMGMELTYTDQLRAPPTKWHATRIMHLMTLMILILYNLLNRLLRVPLER